MATIAELDALVEERRRSLGDAHPDTLTAMLDLAELLWAEGQLSRARQLEEAVVAGRRALYRRGALRYAESTRQVGVHARPAGRSRRGETASGTGRRRDARALRR